MYAALALLVGIAVGLFLHPTVPDWLGPYLPIAVVAALDAVFGGVRASLAKIFDAKVFVISFVANVLVAAFIVFLGDQLGVGSQLSTAVVVVLGIRIFGNAAAIRRHVFKGMTADPRAGGDDPSQPPHQPKGAGRPLISKIAVAALCAVLGFGGVIQVRRTAAGDTLASARPDDLVQILDGLQRREDEENKDITELQDTLARLRNSGASSAEALSEAQRQAEALGILTGTVPATGTGVRIVIDDPDHRVPPELLLDALEELRNAGAEAFQFGAVRVGVDSAFSGSGGAISLDGTALTAPYDVRAIGDPPTLAAALAIPGGVLDTVRRAGGTMVTTQSQKIVIDALRAARTPLYARPAGG